MEQIKKLSPHLIVILLFVGISFAYFSPVMQGKVLDMPDIKHLEGMSKEVTDFREATGEEALWTNSMFSGMPAYQISTKSNANLIQYVVKGYFSRNSKASQSIVLVFVRILFIIAKS